MNARTFSRLALAAALIAPVAAMPATSAFAEPVSIGISVGIAPPMLPVYAQPICPGDGYLWTPGYWAYDNVNGYFWVPGVWVLPPSEGLLWTPAYWGWGGGRYFFHAGYWGPQVGFYGGINYGFGYGGTGFYGGQWRGGQFFYNTAFARVGVGFGNVYVNRVNIVNHQRVSFNGGPNGVAVRPTAQQMQWSHERHIAPTANQLQHQQIARSTPGQRFNTNHGEPAVRAAASYRAYAAHPNNAALASRPDQREGNQDQRIANGVRSGSMTSGEAARANQRQANIDSEVHNDRTTNGGTLTNQERNQVNRQQDNSSRQINNEKHNDRTSGNSNQHQTQHEQSHDSHTTSRDSHNNDQR